MYLLVKQHIGIGKDGEIDCIGHILDHAELISALVPKIEAELAAGNFKSTEMVKSPEYATYCVECVTESEEQVTYKIINVDDAVRKGFPIVSTEGYL